MTDPGISTIYTIWDYDAHTVTRFQREGECNGCGLCCRRKITFSVVNPVEKDNLRQGGWFTSGKGQWIEMKVDGKRVFFRMKENDHGMEACVHLGEDNRCQTYATRPLLCRTWPHSPFDLVKVPECSYTFQILGHWRFEELNVKHASSRVLGQVVK